MTDLTFHDAIAVVQKKGKFPIKLVDLQKWCGNISDRDSLTTLKESFEESVEYSTSQHFKVCRTEEIALDNTIHLSVNAAIRFSILAGTEDGYEVYKRLINAKEIVAPDQLDI